MWRTDSLEKTLMLGTSEGKRSRGDSRWDGWVSSLTQWTWVWASSRSWWWSGKPAMLQSLGSQRIGYDWATELTKNWKPFLSWCFQELTYLSKINTDQRLKVYIFSSLPLPFKVLNSFFSLLCGLPIMGSFSFFMLLTPLKLNCPFIYIHRYTHTNIHICIFTYRDNYDFFNTNLFKYDIL